MLLSKKMSTLVKGDLKAPFSIATTPKAFKMVLDKSFLNTRQYKVRIEGKVEQSTERSSALPYTLV